MRGTRTRIFSAGVAAVALAPCVATAQTTEPQQAVIGAATSFSIAYGVWLWEEHCLTLTPDKRAAFETVINDDMRRLHEAADERLFNAAAGAAKDLANDPKNADCKAMAADGFADFGMEQARDAAAKLATVPPGYHLTIKD
jgi:hypothetical protein